MDYLKLFPQRHFRTVPTEKLLSTFPVGVQTVDMVHYKVDKIFQHGTYIGNLNSNETSPNKTFSNPNFLNINQKNIDIMPTVDTLATYVLQTITESIPVTQKQNLNTTLQKNSNKDNVNEVRDTFYDCENLMYNTNKSPVIESEFEVEKHSDYNRKVKKLRNTVNHSNNLSQCNMKTNKNSRRCNAGSKTKNFKFANKQNILHDIEMDINMDNTVDLDIDSFININEDSSADEYFTGDSDFENIDIDTEILNEPSGNSSENSNDSIGNKRTRMSPDPECSLKKSKMCISNKSPNTNFYRSLIEEISLEKKSEILTKNSSDKRTKCCCNTDSKRNKYKNHTSAICLKDETSNRGQEENCQSYNIIQNLSSMFAYDIVFSKAKCIKPKYKSRNTMSTSVNKNTELNVFEDNNYTEYILPYDNQKFRRQATPYKNNNKDLDSNVILNMKERERISSECESEDSFVFFENESPSQNNTSISDCESDDSFVVFNETPVIPKTSCLRFKNISRKLKGTLNCSKNLFLNLTRSKICNRSPSEQESDDGALPFDDSDSVKSIESPESSAKMFEKLNIDHKGRIRATSECESEDSYIVFGENENDDIDADQFDWNDDDIPTDESDDEDCDSDGCDETDCCSVTSESWVKTVKNETPKKRVQFKSNSQLCIIYPMVQWSHAYQKARKGEWEEAARDRERFKREISKLKDVIDPVISNTHREKIYQERFENNI